MSLLQAFSAVSRGLLAKMRILRARPVPPVLPRTFFDIPIPIIDAETLHTALLVSGTSTGAATLCFLYRSGAFHYAGRKLKRGTLWLMRKLSFRSRRLAAQQTIAPINAEVSEIPGGVRRQRIVKKKQKIQSTRARASARLAADSADLPEPSLLRSVGEASELPGRVGRRMLEKKQRTQSTRKIRTRASARSAAADLTDAAAGLTDAAAGSTDAAPALTDAAAFLTEPTLLRSGNKLLKREQPREHS